MFTSLTAHFKEIVEELSIKAGRVYNLRGSSRALLLVLLLDKIKDSPHILVTGSEELATTLKRDMDFYMRMLASESETLYLPPRDDVAATGKRLKTLLDFTAGKILVGPEDAFLTETWTANELREYMLHLKVGQQMRRETFIERLQWLGYRRVAIVSDRGEFSVRSWVFDVFPTHTDYPFRIEFFGDEVETIKRFEIDSQRSVESLKEIMILPSIEKEGVSLLESLDKEALWYSTEDVRKEIFKKDVTELFSMPMAGDREVKTLPLTGLGLLYNERKDIFGLALPVKNLLGEYRILFVMATASQADRLKEILHESGVIAPVIAPERLREYDGQVAITVATLSEGIHLPGFIILTPQELFGRGPLFRPHKPSHLKRLMEEIDELNSGDYVVHKQHGIGRYLGLRHLKTEHFSTEAVVIEYAEGAKLYLPVQSINLIQKYKAEEGVIPGLDRIGGKTWKKKRERARKKVREIAYKLVRLYAQREIIKGYAFSPDTELHREFESFFPYEETPDQMRAWEEIKRDMEASEPMDRLLCGDVGFGKTEVAMRAAFKAVYDGKQVAVLVPTTILCEQHYRNFIARFAAFPVKIDFLSRFKTPAQRRQTIDALKRGDIDIIIGTHALLSKRVRFYDLGLLIIDEEHRFGVTHKERIKELKKGVDCLTLSATPIPRTLEMALSGIRAMSLIETPPEERLSVKGIVTVFRDETIQEAIRRELRRQGQVFFVHNRVRELEYYYDYLKRLVPEARIVVGHGQMKETELEDVMLSFMDGKADLLLSTSIIGSGIDISRANTIIINRADRMGLADLYQLKGRVGRSNLRAYAYFLIPPPETLSEEARMRIRAIEELNYLGAGLRVAMKDLEIRGAGNLLGKEQSGHIHAVGFDTYMEMLREEVASLRGVEIEEEIEPTIEIDIEAYIPEDYVYDMSLRLSLYRKISLAATEEDIRSLEEELRDRFGEPPPPVRRLLDIMLIKSIARVLRISTIRLHKGMLRFIFIKDTPLSPERLLGHLSSLNASFQLHEDGFSIKAETEAEQDMAEGIIRVLKPLMEEVAVAGC